MAVDKAFIRKWCTYYGIDEADPRLDKSNVWAFMESILRLAAETEECAERYDIPTSAICPKPSPALAGVDIEPGPKDWRFASKEELEAKEKELRQSKLVGDRVITYVGLPKHENFDIGDPHAARRERWRRRHIRKG